VCTLESFVGPSAAQLLDDLLGAQKDAQRKVARQDGWIYGLKPLNCEWNISVAYRSPDARSGVHGVEARIRGYVGLPTKGLDRLFVTHRKQKVQNGGFQCASWDMYRLHLALPLI
jgi:hypothetical protein